MVGWVCYEERSEVRTAGGEDELVCLEGEAVRGETDVSETLVPPLLLEDVEQLVVVISPLQHILRNLFINKLLG